MRPFVLLFCFILSLTHAETPARLTAKESEELITAARAILDAFNRGDSAGIVSGTHVAIEKFGITRQQLAELTANVMKQLQADGISFESMQFGEPSQLWKMEAGDLCFLPKTSVIKKGEQRIESQAFLVCVRKEGKWTFLESASLAKNPKLLWVAFPDLPKDVKMPPTSMKEVGSATHR